MSQARPTPPNLRARRYPAIIAAMPTSRRAPYTKTHVDIRRANLSDDSPKEPKRARPPRRMQKEVVEKFRAHTDEVLARFMGIIRDPDADYSSVIAAGKEILARGNGAVAQHHVIEALFTNRAEIDITKLGQMSDAELKFAEQVLARMLAAHDDVEDAEVIDHEPKSDTDHEP